MLDDVTGGKDARQPNGQYKEPKRKYMDMLRKVADREVDEVTIELDDLENVRGQFSFQNGIELIELAAV